MVKDQLRTRNLCSGDFRVLFELIQSIGTSLNAQENCHAFLKALQKNAGLSYASIWLKGCYIFPQSNDQPAEHFYLFTEIPEKGIHHISIAPANMMLHQLSNQVYTTTTDRDGQFDLFVHEYDITEVCYGFMKIGDMGFLKLYRNAKQDTILPEELKELLPIIDKLHFTLSVLLKPKVVPTAPDQQHTMSKMLAESLNQYQTVVENINEGLIVTDLEDRIVYANRQISIISGHSRDQLIGAFAHKLFTPESEWKHIPSHIAERLQGKSDTLTLKQKKPNGKTWWSLIHASPYRSADGSIIGTINVINDITEQKKAEKSLRASEAKIRAIINSALDAVVVINQKGMVTEWNSQAEMIFGWSQEEMQGLPLAETIIPPQFREAHHNGFHHYLETGEGPALNQRLEITAMNRRGNEFPIELTIIPIKLDDEHFFSAFIRDITERKRAEEKRENLLKQLAQANSELKDFAYVVSHDLKAPLRAISSLARWIADDYEDQFDEDGKQQLNLLRGRVNRMSELITGILNYSRIGRVNTEIDELDTHQTVLEIIDLINNNNQVEITIPEHLPVIKYNKISFQQVVQNLVSNAIKYHDKENGLVEIGFFKGLHQHTFWVKDNGPGISPKYHEKIFRIFQTLRPRDEVEATGVGLSIVKKIVHLFGGKVWVESELGQGSCFYFTIPHIPKLNLDI